MRLAALILTGGRSQRMGRPKEFLPFAGETLLSRTAATLASCADPVGVVRRDADQELPALPAAVVLATDENRLAGPLGALASGLRCLRDGAGLDAADAVFVTGCDAPFLTAAVVRGLAECLAGVDLAMPVVDAIRQPLLAVYRVRILDTIDALLATGNASPQSLPDHVPTRLVDTDELRGIDPTLRCLVNVNTSAEYERALRELGGLP